MAKKLTEDHKRKISESRTGQKLSDETKRKIGNARRGKKHSLASRSKIAAFRRGKRHSEETILKIKEAGQKRYGMMLMNRNSQKSVISAEE